MITPDQSEELAKLVSASNTDIHKFLQHANVESLSDLPALAFEGARNCS